jgi:alpha/beta superfamily hydrolase
VEAHKVTFDTADGNRLEGRLVVPAEARGGAVLCHPHPLYGGSMSSAIIPALQRALEAKRWASLRFNFRGVRLSEGRYGGGVAEVKDVSAALDRLADAVPGAALAVAGWSFGALVGMAAAVADPRVEAFVAVAPPISMEPHMELPPMPAPERLQGWRARVLGVCGTNDQFCKPDDLKRWAAGVSATAEVRIFEGEDHYFSGAGEELATVVADFIAGG